MKMTNPHACRTCRQRIGEEGYCPLPAVGGFLWPGQKHPQPVCATHLLKARATAEAIGFTLHEVTLEALLAADAVAHLEAMNRPFSIAGSETGRTSSARPNLANLRRSDDDES